jgi:hypothetical protein
MFSILDSTNDYKLTWMPVSIGIAEQFGLINGIEIFFQA